MTLTRKLPYGLGNYFLNNENLLNGVEYAYYPRTRATREIRFVDLLNFKLKKIKTRTNSRGVYFRRNRYEFSAGRNRTVKRSCIISLKRLPFFAEGFFFFFSLTEIYFLTGQILIPLEIIGFLSDSNGRGTQYAA